MLASRKLSLLNESHLKYFNDKSIYLHNKWPFFKNKITNQNVTAI